MTHGLMVAIYRFHKGGKTKVMGRVIWIGWAEVMVGIGNSEFVFNLGDGFDTDRGTMRLGFRSRETVLKLSSYQ